MSSPSVITIECCGLLVGSTSEEIAEHIRAAWLTGQECIDLVRAEFGPHLADVHAPIVNGGVQIHKLQGVMHYTCNTANKTARLAKTLRETSGQFFLVTMSGRIERRRTDPGLTFCAEIIHATFQWTNSIRHITNILQRFPATFTTPVRMSRNLKHIYAAH
jgi:hypothetical protein